MQKAAEKGAEKKLVVLLDSHAMLHRSYHAFPNLKTESGIPSGAIFGMFQMVLRVISEFKPHAVVACYDLPGGTFRHTAFDGYKGTRSETDTDLVRQIEESYGLCKAWNIPVVQSPGFEADDCIGTLSEKLYNEGYQVIIASGDRDTLQLVHGRDVMVWTLKKTITDSIVFDEDAVIEYYSFPPKLVPDYKAFAGDSSDNIPGIRGIGDKTARTIISSIGSLEDIYNVIEHEPSKLSAIVTKRMFELIRDGREDAEFSKVLGTIRLDAPVSVSIPDESFLQTVPVDALTAFCRQYTFTSILPKVEKLFSLKSSTPSKEVRSKIVQKNQQTLFGTEPGAIDTDSDEVSDDETAEEKGNVPVDPELRELQIMRWMLDPRVTHATEPELLYWSKATNRTELRAYMESELQQTNMIDLWKNCEQKLIPIISKMTEAGILLDTVLLGSIKKTLTAELEECEQSIYREAGQECNIQSPKQLSELLFTTLAIQTKGIKKNKSGGYSTQESELEKIKDLHPVVELILQHRGLAKLLNTYIETLPNWISADGRLHPIFHQDGTTTGRFSCSNPNIQNIPIRGKSAEHIRKAFTVPAGKVLVRFDYSQIELRIAALLAGEKSMQTLFRKNIDIHTGVAARMFGVDIGLVTKDMRRKAKTINFGILYGMGIAALAADMGVSRSEAEDFMDRYRTQFSALSPYFTDCIASAKEKGYCSTLFSRRRFISELQSINPGLRAYGERIAMNAPIQGTAADVMKFGMILADELIQGKFPEIHMMAQVHDELLFEVPTESVRDFCVQMKRTLESVLEVYAPRYAAETPLVVECETGPNWGETKGFVVG
jgi:DNA polymerase-1